MDKEAAHWWATTLEGRRQLIWEARREGYLMAVRDLKKQLRRVQAALDGVQESLKQMESEPVEPAP